MAKKKTIKINKDLCIGCGECVKSCQGGALKMVNGKAELVDADYCDGLYHCIGECAAGAISVETTEEENSLSTDFSKLRIISQSDMDEAKSRADAAHESRLPMELDSQLTHWPIQLSLIGYGSDYYKNADLLVAADCSSFACADFHNSVLRGRKIVIACPKLDNNKEIYIQKLKGLIDSAMVNTITVAQMEVPCCNGLLSSVKTAVERSIRKVPIKRVVISIKGEILSEEWLS